MFVIGTTLTLCYTSASCLHGASCNKLRPILVDATPATLHRMGCQLCTIMPTTRSQLLCVRMLACTITEVLLAEGLPHFQSMKCGLRVPECTQSPMWHQYKRVRLH